MGEGGSASEFDAARAELFEALGHPIRIKILHALQDGPLGFADLKRKVGIESGGHLQFHLGKLDGLIRSGDDGNYSLTDDGKEALRIIGADGRRPSDKGEGRDRIVGIPFHRILTVGLLVVLILISSVAVYQQLEIGGLNSSVSQLQQENSGLNSTVANLQQQTKLGSCGASEATRNFNFTPNAPTLSPSGLGINLTVSSQTISCGDTVYAAASLFNPLGHNLTLAVNASAFSSLNGWAYDNAKPCGSNGPVELAVFDGYYDPSNFSKAGQPLQLTSPDERVSCIGVNQPSPNAFVFLPFSGTAYALFNGTLAQNAQPTSFSSSLQHWVCIWHSLPGRVQSDCGASQGASGYYVAATSASNGFHLFHFGTYTVAATDVWGDLALAYFTVQ